MKSTLNGNKELILVDNDPNTSMLIRKCLEKAGIKANIHETDSSNEAMRLLACSRTDLLVTEIRLNDGNGLQLLHSLKNLDVQSRPSNVLVISNLLAPEVKNYSGNFVTFMAKPCGIEGLTHFLTKHLKRPVESQNPPGPGVTVEIFKAFRDGLNLYFENSLKSPIKLSRFYIEKNDEMIADVSAVLEIFNPTFTGKMLLTMNDDCFRKLTSKIISKKGKPECSSSDALSELCGHVFLCTKMILARGGCELEAATAEVFENKGYAPTGHQRPFRVVCDVTSSFGDFSLQFCILKTSENV